MTNTSLLIIAIMLVVILIQMVINIAIADSNMKLNDKLNNTEYLLEAEKKKNIVLQDELEYTRCWLNHHKNRADEAGRDYLKQAELNNKIINAITKLGFYRIVSKEVDKDA